MIKSLREAGEDSGPRSEGREGGVEGEEKGEAVGASNGVPPPVPPIKSSPSVSEKSSVLIFLYSRLSSPAFLHE